MTQPQDPQPADVGSDAWLSDLADGRLDAADLPRRCTQWADDPQCRRTWHAYQLIGDVLRSDDLARDAAHDAQFLGRLRQRLAQEPALPAPAPTPPRRLAHRAWSMPLAAAAGVVAVVGVVVLLQPAGGGVQLAAAPQQPRPQAPALALAPDAAMLRDARVDEYLQMHRQTLAGAPVALPGGAMRSVDLALPQR